MIDFQNIDTFILFYFMYTVGDEGRELTGTETLELEGFELLGILESFCCYYCSLK